jgi:hypothetical protein
MAMSKTASSEADGARPSSASVACGGPSYLRQEQVSVKPNRRTARVSSTHYTHVVTPFYLPFQADRKWPRVPFDSHVFDELHNVK